MDFGLHTMTQPGNEPKTRVTDGYGNTGEEHAIDYNSADDG